MGIVHRHVTVVASLKAEAAQRVSGQAYGPLSQSESEKYVPPFHQSLVTQTKIEDTFSEVPSILPQAPGGLSFWRSTMRRETTGAIYMWQ